MNEYPPKKTHFAALPNEVDIYRLWDDVGKLMLDGKLTLRAAQRMCRMMIVASSSRDEGRGLLGALSPKQASSPR